jgi:hypothetical protein
MFSVKIKRLFARGEATQNHKYYITSMVVRAGSYLFSILTSGSFLLHNKFIQIFLVLLFSFLKMARTKVSHFSSSYLWWKMNSQ